MMKRLLSMLIALAMIVTLFSVPVLGEGDVTVFTVSSATALPGEDVAVTVSVSGNEVVSGLTLQIDYDPSLTVVTETVEGEESIVYEDGDFLTAARAGNAFVLLQDKVDEAGDSQHMLGFGLLILESADVVANGDIFTVHFHVPENAAPGTELPINITVSDFSYLPLGAAPEDAVSYDHTEVNGCIEVKSTAKHTVTFDSNGGSLVPSQQVYNGRPVAAPEDPVRDGFTFCGWTLDGSLYDFDTPVTGDITLVAFWVEDGQVMYLDYDVNTEEYVPSVQTNVQPAAVTMGDGWYITGSLKEQFDSVVSIEGVVNLILRDGTEFTATKGVVIADGCELNIYCQSTGSSMGSFHASTTTRNKAGIAVTDASITINGGVINAEGGRNAAGIGGANNDPCGTVTINGGSVTAKGGTGAAGIGSGKDCDDNESSVITINGGSVSVTGVADAAAIGGGINSHGGSIVINGGVVNAVADSNGYGIGGGYDEENDDSMDAVITLGWTNDKADSIFATSYTNAPTFVKPFMLQGQDVRATADNIDGETIVPASRPEVSGQYIEIRNKVASDSTKDLRFVFKVDFNDSFVRFNAGSGSADYGPKLNGYEITNMLMTIGFAAGTKSITVTNNKIWEMNADAGVPNYLFTMVITNIPENMENRVIELTPTIELGIDGAADNVVGAVFAGSLGNAE